MRHGLLFYLSLLSAAFTLSFYGQNFKQIKLFLSKTEQPVIGISVDEDKRSR